MLPRVIPRKTGTRGRAVLRCGAGSFVLRSWLGAKTAKNGSQRPGSWLGARQDDVRGLSFRNAPFVSSRSAPIRDLALALSRERRCRIGVRHDGKGGKDGFSLLSLFLSSLLPRTWTRSVGTRNCSKDVSVHEHYLHAGFLIIPA